MKTRLLAALIFAGATFAPMDTSAQAAQARMQARLAQARLAQTPPGARTPGRRDALEAQVLIRFAMRASDELALDATQRTRLNQVIRETAVRRKQLNQRSLALHRRFAQAIRDQATAPDEFTRLLADQTALRREEQQIADSEQTELQRFLSPRQQAHFLMLWIRLQDNARQIQSGLPNGRIGGLPE